MAGEYINSKAGEKRIKKQWKYREKKDELHTFKDTTKIPQPKWKTIIKYSLCILIYYHLKSERKYLFRSPSMLKLLITILKELHILSDTNSKEIHSPYSIFDEKKPSYHIQAFAKTHINARSPDRSSQSGLQNKKRQLPTLPHCIAVPSAQSGLTSLFGMGRGGTPTQ